MKVRIHSDEYILSGYSNLRVGSYEQLSLTINDIDQGALDELLVDHTIDFLPLDKAEEMLSRLTRLVKKGGKFVVTGTDIYEVSKAFANYHIDIADVNRHVFGNSKRLAFSAVTMSNLLQHNLQMKIIKKRVNEFIYTIEAQR